MQRRDFLAYGVAGTVGLMSGARGFAQGDANAAVIRQAFSYAYPLVLMDATRQAMSSKQAGGENRFVHYRKHPTQQFSLLVAPHPDMLLSSAWLDLSEGPLVLSVPDLSTRFAYGSIFHAWYDVLGRFGTVENGGKPTQFLITGPGQSASPPAGVKLIESPTRTVWVPVWMLAGDEEDQKVAHDLQNELKIMPLADWKPELAAKPAATGANPFGNLLNKFLKPPMGGQPPMPPKGVPLDPATIELARKKLQEIDPSGKKLAEFEAALAANPMMTIPEGLMPANPATLSLGRKGDDPAMMMNNDPAMAADPAMMTPEAGAGYAGGGDGMGSGGGASPNATVFGMDETAFYNKFCELMGQYPPLEEDALLVGKLTKAGLTPGATLDVKSLPRATQSAFAAGTRRAGERVFGARGRLKVLTSNRWETPVNMENFGTDYDRRAWSALMALGSGSPQSILTSRISKDSTGKALNGSGKFTLTFAAGQLPPSSHGWSLSVYRYPDMALLEQGGGKTVLGSRDQLVASPSGSTVIYLQKDNPGADKESNWLPLPEGPIEIMLRIYGPAPEVAGLQWRPPALNKA